MLNMISAGALSFARGKQAKGANCVPTLPLSHSPDSDCTRGAESDKVQSDVELLTRTLE
jgi:hypothetical protein